MSSALILRISHCLVQNAAASSARYLSTARFSQELQHGAGIHSTQHNYNASISLSCYERAHGSGQHDKQQDYSQTKWPNFSAKIVGGGALALTLPFFSSKDDDSDDTPENKLIMTIKRSILCMQRMQYDKAEQMLHLALRMAQDIQSKEGVMHVFDIMANLAMEREQYKKAEKLFVDVMQRLFADGHTEDSPKMLHISAKLAHMSHLQGDLDKALTGFNWTLQKLEGVLKHAPEDMDMKELLGLTKNWFGQLLIKQRKYEEAKKYLQEAYDCLVDIYGQINEEAITILNNLSVVCVNLENLPEARKYIEKALALAKELNDYAQEGVLKANLGLIFMQEGLLLQAKEICSQAYRLGKKHNLPEVVEQASYCLDELKSFTEK